jgi:hypothetical protein
VKSIGIRQFRRRQVVPADLSIPEVIHPYRLPKSYQWLG